MQIVLAISISESEKQEREVCLYQKNVFSFLFFFFPIRKEHP
jgi:hypothetical protein